MAEKKRRRRSTVSDEARGKPRRQRGEKGSRERRRKRKGNKGDVTFKDADGKTWIDLGWTLGTQERLEREEKGLGKPKTTVSKKVLKMIKAVETEAIEKGWLLEWLYDEVFWNLQPPHYENVPGLAACLDNHQKILEVTDEFIRILLRDGVNSSLFFKPATGDAIIEYRRALEVGELKKVSEVPQVEEVEVPKEPVAEETPSEPPTSFADRFKKPEERKSRRSDTGSLDQSPIPPSSQVEEPPAPEPGCLF